MDPISIVESEITSSYSQTPSTKPPTPEPLNPTEEASRTQYGPMAIFWDIENCSIPKNIRPEDAAKNILKAVQNNGLPKRPVTSFSAYGDFNAFPPRIRQGCQRTGIRLIDVPSGKKDAADKAILIDMFLFALDNRAPSTILLISGDVDFAPALHVLGQRGYTIVLAVPSRNGVSSALSNAGKFVWDWNGVIRGEASVTKACKKVRSSPVKILRREQGGADEIVKEMCCFQEEEEEDDGMIEGLKKELQELIVCYGYRPVPLHVFEEFYVMRYGKGIDFESFGVSGLDELIDKVKDVVEVVHDKVTMCKFLQLVFDG